MQCLQRKYSEAEPLYREALQILEDAYGAADPRLGAALHNVAGFHWLTHDMKRAEEYYRKAVQVRAHAHRGS